ncbi:MAG: hypothetical protein HGB11_09525 [Chlorobiales bacterium]|nr:hypothetical protein [Chlorobiales bacterium]
MRLWDAQTGKPIHSYSGHKKPVHAIDFDHDGKTIVSGALDFCVKLWKVVRS